MIAKQKLSTINYVLDQMKASERDAFVSELSLAGTQTGEALRNLMGIKNIGPITALEVLLAVIGKCENEADSDLANR